MARFTDSSLRSFTFWFLTGAGLVQSVVFAFVLVSAAFITGIGLTAWIFPLSVALALLMNYFSARFFMPDEAVPIFIRTSGIILLVICLSVIISGLFFDISADGQMYHMESAIQMKAGWNPFKKELPANFNQAIWLNHYGKGVEDPQAAIYALTNRLETTKSTNFILLAGSLGLCMSFFVRLGRFSFRKNILFSVLLAFNPVTFYQLLNTYVDGQLCSFLLCLIAVAGLLYLDVNRSFLILLASVLVITVNIKFTALVFAGIFCAGILSIFYFSHKIRAWKQALWVCVLAAGFGITVVGYFPYVINTVRYHDVLYPGLPMLKSEALKFTPPRLRGKNQLSKFFISFFSHTDNLHLTVTRDPPIHPKIPFTLNQTDVFNAAKPYVVFIAGLGPFFSGICLSSLFIFGYGVWCYRDWKTKLPIILAAGTLLISVLIISEAWYVRYVPQLWFFPLVLLIGSEMDPGNTLRKIRHLLYIVMLFNISFCLASFPYVFFKTSQIRHELEQLKASGETIPVEFTYFTSNRARFTEYGIPFTEVKIPDSTAVFMSSSSTKIIPPKRIPDVPRSWVLRTGERIVHRFHLE